MSSRLITPRNTLIENTAGKLAATWYEIGRSQGLKSKWPTARKYAAANLEKFIPAAVDILLTMLDKPHVTAEMKEEIYEALMERHNDPELMKIMPNIDIKKVLLLAEEMERKKAPIEINTIKKSGTVLDNNVNLLDNNVNPFKAQRH